MAAPSRVTRALLATLAALTLMAVAAHAAEPHADSIIDRVKQAVHLGGHGDAHGAQDAASQGVEEAQAWGGKVLGEAQQAASEEHGAGQDSRSFVGKVIDSVLGKSHPSLQDTADDVAAQAKEAVQHGTQETTAKAQTATQAARDTAAAAEERVVGGARDATGGVHDAVASAGEAVKERAAAAADAVRERVAAATEAVKGAATRGEEEVTIRAEEAWDSSSGMAKDAAGKAKSKLHLVEETVKQEL